MATSVFILLLVINYEIIQYIPKIDLPILLRKICGPILRIIAQRHVNVEIGKEAAQFPEKEYISGIFVEVQTRMWALIRCRCENCTGKNLCEMWTTPTLTLSKKVRRTSLLICVMMWVSK